jgi:Holliday junction resolvase RusA-like endonuclease
MKHFIELINHTPFAKKRHRWANGHTYDPMAKQLKQVRELLKYEYDGSPLALPCRVYIIAAFKRPQSHFNKSGLKPSAPTEHIQKPDADNILKFYLDAGNGVLWEDDKYITRATCEKIWRDDFECVWMEIAY